jgi:hypothetical protein
MIVFYFIVAVSFVELFIAEGAMKYTDGDFYYGEWKSDMVC